MNYTCLGENVKKIRKNVGLKQQELADKIGINLQNLSKIERGINYPTYETLEKIMTTLNVKPNALLCGPLTDNSKTIDRIHELLDQHFEVCSTLRILKNEETEEEKEQGKLTEAIKTRDTFEDEEATEYVYKVSPGLTSPLDEELEEHLNYQRFKLMEEIGELLKKLEDETFEKISLIQ